MNLSPTICSFCLVLAVICSTLSHSQEVAVPSIYEEYPGSEETDDDSVQHFLGSGHYDNPPVPYQDNQELSNPEYNKALWNYLLSSEPNPSLRYISSSYKRRLLSGLLGDSLGPRFGYDKRGGGAPSPYMFHGSRGKRLGPSGEELLPLDVSDGRRLSALQLLSLGLLPRYADTIGLHTEDKREPPFTFHGARG